MRVEINGAVRELEEGTSVETMLRELELPRDGIAVEINREIVPRSAHPKTLLEEGDIIEIVTFVGGG